MLLNNASIDLERSRGNVFVGCLSPSDGARGTERLCITPSPHRSDVDIEHLVRVLVWVEVGLAAKARSIAACPFGRGSKTLPKEDGTPISFSVGNLAFQAFRIIVSGRLKFCTQGNVQAVEVVQPIGDLAMPTWRLAWLTTA